MAEYSVVLASFVGERDGMALELHDSSGEAVAEVFEADATGACAFSMRNGASVPVMFISELLRKAAEEFPQAR
ncbi:hypothetical protein ACNUCX_01205 [Curtobacterium flaccumfaciens pv. flaccumfaciens]|jgi:hypothetical protein|uniref:hypothetical protein n=1 Tax=Curtobacterium flaccumfaciens TaxID=2035 RepID=UPI003AB790A5